MISKARSKALIQCGNRYSSWRSLVAAVLHFPSAPFWKAWTGRMDEQNVEAKLDDDSRCGCIAVAEAGLSILLARLRWSFEFGWIGIPNIGPVPVAGYSGLSAVLVIASLWNAWPQRAAVPDCRAEKSLK